MAAAAVTTTTTENNNGKKKKDYLPKNVKIYKRQRTSIEK